MINDGKVVGIGATRPAGQAHAEVVALERARGAAAGATLYVTLEPCSHFGRTPPCTRAILEAGVKRVVAACPDPNPKVSGLGFEQLRRAGVRVDIGPTPEWRARAEEFYAGFFFWIRNGRPRIVAKVAQGLDGRINAAPGLETAITGAEARRYAHALRASADAILVGGKTLRADDPDLTPRLTGGRPPQPLILTRKGSFSPKYRVFSKSRTVPALVVSPKRPRGLPPWVEHAPLAGRDGLVQELLEVFRDRGYHEVLLEGGRDVWTPFLNAGLCDVLHVVTAPKLFPGGDCWGDGLRPGWAKPLEFHRFTPLGSDRAAEFRRRD